MTLTSGFQDTVSQAVITSHGRFGSRIKGFGVGVVPASTAWPLANRAYAIPFYLTVPTTILEIFFVSGTSPGTTNYDLGIYRDDFTRIVSLGATAAVNTTDAILPVGGGDIADTTLAPGRYYMAMSSAANTLTVRASVNANGIMRAFGMQMMDTAHPLPTTFTPVTLGTSAFMPLIGLALVTNVL